MSPLGTLNFGFCLSEATHLQNNGQLLRGAPVLHTHCEPYLERGQLLCKEWAVLWEKQRSWSGLCSACLPWPHDKAEWWDLCTAWMWAGQGVRRGSAALALIDEYQ